MHWNSVQEVLDSHVKCSLKCVQFYLVSLYFSVSQLGFGRIIVDNNFNWFVVENLMN